VEPKAIAISVLGVGVLTLLRQGGADKEMSLGITRVDLNRLAEAVVRLGQTPACLAYPTAALRGSDRRRLRSRTRLGR
jgi:hypothetical protein